MRTFKLFAGGYYTEGMCVVVAHDEKEAINMANEATDPKWKLKYHGGARTEVMNFALNVTCPLVVFMHEYGTPNLPSKGSGAKVTF